ncbi:armadillo-type protein [Fimicolochytrium jonesii]|uniref:armadillo-type protein n=1 Tax=Fimicolochytrium jonesii TaxID=1396493 RepID=UPI0022FEA89F|nr:armadillo-type protein [Fimicolochytrium jonesii]KAI8820667.1 armadillo-type protein [Fimicolochytrium jonesii]
MQADQEQRTKPSGQEDGETVHLEHRRELRKANLEAYVQRPDLSTKPNLDGSIKKNTSFVRKLKTLTHDQVASLSKELVSLKLEKYVSEIVAAISEAKFKTSSDIWAAVEICSLLHQRFANFGGELVQALCKQLGPPPLTHGMSPEQKEKEEVARIGRQKSSLRLLADLYTVGIIRDGKGCPFPQVLKDMFLADKDQHVNLPIAVVFAKYHGQNILGTEGSPTGLDAVSDANGTEEVKDIAVTCQEPLVPAEVQSACREVFIEYYNSLVRHLVHEHKRVRNIEKSNHEHYIARGEINEDRQERYQKNLRAYEKLLGGTKVLSETLGQAMPPLPEDESITRMGIGITDSTGEKDDQDTLSGPWEDDDSKAFYENLIDLRNHVPAIFLGEKKPAIRSEPSLNEEAQDTADPIGSPDDAHQSQADDGQTADISSEDEDGKATSPISPEEDDDAKVDEEEADLDGDDETKEKDAKPVSGASNAALESVINRLPTALNRDTIDQIAIDFAFLNSKGARKKLTRVLLTVPRQRMELLPYYSRLIATVSAYIPEIGAAVVEQLEKTFHGQQKRKEQVFIEEKTKIIRYLAELTKFRVTPQHVIFHCIKVLLDNFKHHNIELLCVLLESCGRFLFKSPETHLRTSNYLDILMRKKNVEHVDSRQTFMIENAYYQCNPPDKPATEAKARPPMELYVRKLIYSDMSKKTVDKVLKQLRKLNWADPIISKMLTNIFCKIWKVKYSQLHMMAYMASELSRYYPDFGVSIVDSTLEEIRVGLEQNIFKHNQRRISIAKYLGELYNYRMIDSALVFQTLFHIVSYGHENNMPQYGVGNVLDAPHDFFRVRLSCIILDACGQCFDRGMSAKRLDLFLVYLQMYIHTKLALPMDIEFVISETYELLRPKMRIPQTYEEAVAEYSKLATEQMQAINNGANGGAAGDESDDDDEDDGGKEQGSTRRGGRDSDEEQEDVDKAVDDVVIEEIGETEEEEAFGNEQNLVDQEFEQEFEREFSRMMQESMETRRRDGKSAFDAPVPVRMKTAANASESNEAIGGDQVAFTLLTRRGNKQQAKTMALPADSSFVISTRNKQEAEQEEKQHLKRLVLNYEEREREAARKARPPQLRCWKKAPCGTGQGQQSSLVPARTPEAYTVGAVSEAAATKPLVQPDQLEQPAQLEQLAQLEQQDQLEQQGMVVDGAQTPARPEQAADLPNDQM